MNEQRSVFQPALSTATSKREKVPVRPGQDLGVALVQPRIYRFTHEGERVEGSKLNVLKESNTFRKEPKSRVNTIQ